MFNVLYYLLSIILFLIFMVFTIAFSGLMMTIFIENDNFYKTNNYYKINQNELVD